MKKDAFSDPNYLQNRLKEKMSEVGISAHALEKKAGLRRSAVQNILQGRSKKPSAQILHAITKILGCGINDLLTSPNGTSLGFSQQPFPEYDHTSTPDSMDLSLYAEAVRVANQIISQLPVQPSGPETMNYMQEIYQYALSNGYQHIDQPFAEWLARKCFIK